MSNYPRLDEAGLTRLINKLAEQILLNKNVQADWNETDNTSDAYIKNKPTEVIIPIDPATVPTNNGSIWITTT